MNSPSDLSNLASLLPSYGDFYTEPYTLSGDFLLITCDETVLLAFCFSGLGGKPATGARLLMSFSRSSFPPT